MNLHNHQLKLPEGKKVNKDTIMMLKNINFDMNYYCYTSLDTSENTEINNRNIYGISNINETNAPISNVNDYTKFVHLVKKKIIKKPE